MPERADALLLPADSPPSNSEIKKALLFFDSVTLANPSDQALVNDREVFEDFPGARIAWSCRNTFPRDPDYSDSFQHLISNTKTFQSRGLLRLTPSGPLPSLDAAVNYCIWHSAIADQNLVTAAAPDRHTSESPPNKAYSYMSGGVLTVAPYRSKYEITEVRPAYEFSDATEWWTLYAHLRLGRALKFLRLAHALSLTPLAFDKPNQGILEASSDLTLLVDKKNNQQPSPPSSPIYLRLEMFDSLELHKALAAMSWDDISKLRKHTLPGMNKLRSYLRRNLQLQHKSAGLAADAYTKALLDLQKDFQNEKEKLALEWEKLRIAAITKFGGVIGGEALAHTTGLVGTLIGVPWADLLIKIFAGGLLAGGALSGELQRLIPAQRVVKQHPLYFTDRLPTSKIT